MANPFDIDLLGHGSAHTETAKSLSKVIIVSSVQDAVGKIQKVLGSRGTIQRLRIFGHGEPGVQGVGGGSKPSKDQILASVWENKKGFFGGRKLYALAGRFASGWFSSPLIELHGCRTGLGEDGDELLYLIANTLNVRVRAGMQLQETGSPSANDEFEGGFKEMKPGAGTKPEYRPFA